MSEAEPQRNPAVLSSLLAGLFEPAVAAAELRGSADAALLDSREAALSASFAPKRRAEFAAGRLCAHRALAELGIADVVIGIQPDRSPQWPPQIVGSITHTAGFCGAVVADSRCLAGIGIDAETIGRVTPDIHSLVFTEEEGALLAAFDSDLQARAATIVFSAKEAYYKCQYPVTRAWRDFRDVSLELTSSDWRAGDFTVRPSRTSPVTDWGLALPLRGRFQIEDNFAITGIATPGARSGTILTRTVQ